MASTIREELSGSRHRTGDRSTVSASPGPGRRARAGARIFPMATTCDRTVTPSSSRNDLQK